MRIGERLRTRRQRRAEERLDRQDEALEATANAEALYFASAAGIEEAELMRATRVLGAARVVVAAWEVAATEPHRRPWGLREVDRDDVYAENLVDALEALAAALSPKEEE